MSLVLIILPVCAFVCVFIFLHNRFPHTGNRQGILRTSILSGIWVVFTLEILSLFNGITQFSMILVWLAPSLAFGFWAYREHRQGRPVRLPTIHLPERWTEWVVLAGIVFVLGVTLTVALISPPQTWDSLSYHLSRVAEWAQNRSIHHFATGINRQVSMSPGAEQVTLTYYVLTQSDRFSNLPQWFAMLGSLFGVSLIARQLGSKPAGEWIAALFAATLPIGIVESSSTITDFVATFWTVCVAVETLTYIKDKDRKGLYFASLAAGLAVLTKPITVTYLLPFAIGLFVFLLRREKLAGTLRYAATAVVLVFAVNAGYLARNVITYGSFTNPVDVGTHLNELRTPQGFLSNVIKHSGLHAGLPIFPGWTDELNVIIQKAHIKLKVEIQDPRTTGDGVFQVRPPSTQEDLASNPYHAYLILAVFILSFFLIRRIGWLGFSYGVGIVVSFLLFSMFFKWHVFSPRYHLLFFVLISPLIGLVLGLLDKIRIGNILVIGLLFTSIPWLFSIDSRPLLPKEGVSMVDSILKTPREHLYFANALGHEEFFTKIASDIQAAQCNQVGLMLNGDDPEYLFWHLLGAPNRDLHIEWIVSDVTTRYESADFKPCAVICNECPADWTDIRGNQLFEQFGVWQLFMNPK